MMTSLIRRNPSNAMSAFEPIFRNFFGPTRYGDNFLQDWPEEGTRAWMPNVDIQETEQAYEVACELPGMTKDDVDITVENRMLTLRGERKWADDQDEGNYHRIERAYGKFTRTFSLPQTVSADDVDARFKDGVLWITIPKAEEAKPRKIAIH